MKKVLLLFLLNLSFANALFYQYGNTAIKLLCFLLVIMNGGCLVKKEYFIHLNETIKKENHIY